MSTRRDEWLEAVEALRDEWLEAVELARGPLGLGTERADGKGEALAYAAGRLARILDAVPDVPPAEARVWHLRVGRKVGRTIYEQRGRRPSDGDVLIGLMDTPEWARLVVDAVNAVPDVPPDPPAVDRPSKQRVYHWIKTGQLGLSEFETWLAVDAADVRARIEKLCDEATVPVLPGGPPMWLSVNLVRAALDVGRTRPPADTDTGRGQ